MVEKQQCLAVFTDWPWVGDPHLSASQMFGSPWSPSVHIFSELYVQGPTRKDMQFLYLQDFVKSSSIGVHGGPPGTLAYPYSSNAVPSSHQGIWICWSPHCCSWALTPNGRCFNNANVVGFRSLGGMHSKETVGSWPLSLPLPFV
jgi:hypothetical protein